MTWLVPLPVVMPLLGAALTLLIRRHPNLQRGVSLLVLSATLTVASVLLALTVNGDPLAQAMILTAIVITLGMTAFLLAMAYRSWVLTGHDEVQDDIEDRRIMLRAERDEGPESQDATDTRSFTDDADAMDGVAAALQERLDDRTSR